MYTFSAKEKDTETGYSYFGSRYYNSDLSIWLSVDPMSDKYPSLSPYTYCADNPIKLVDPNGEEWEIDGYIYTPGGTCPDNVSQSTKDKWNTMNKLYNTKNGKTVIDALSGEDCFYKISSDKISEKGSGAYVSSGSKSGNIYLNGNNSSISVLAHEVFHAYQDYNGQGGPSIFNNVEAYLFQYSVGGNYMLQTDDDNIDGLYISTLNRLVSSDTFNEDDFNFILNNFTDCAKANRNGIYDSFPVQLDNQKTSLIQSFFPLK